MKRTNLIVDTFCLECFLLQNEEQTGSEHDNSVTEITEHDGEEEREGDNRIWS